MTVRIPKILWRIWIDDPMPEQFQYTGDKFRSLHPHWQFREIRSYSDVPKLVNQELFDRAREIVPNDWKRFQADLLRLELLHKYGGIYVDTDVNPIKPFDPLVEHQEVLVAWSPNCNSYGNHPLTQAVLGAAPGHPWIGECVTRIPHSVEKFKKRPLAQMVGPWHITRVWKDTPYGVVPLPSRIFYPTSIKKRDAGVNPLIAAAEQGSYCAHYWNNTLRKQGKGLG